VDKEQMPREDLPAKERSRVGFRKMMNKLVGRKAGEDAQEN
jgi:hypothetical protein